MLKDGTLIGQRPHPKGPAPLAAPFPVDAKQYPHWVGAQAWLYTKDEFDEFDLHVEYWLPVGGNSGFSIRDSSRRQRVLRPGEREDAGAYRLRNSASGDKDRQRIHRVRFTTSRPLPAGELRNDWNKMDIESRHKMIRVRLNGKLAAESPGVPDRPLKGPIGLQLHDSTAGFCSGTSGSV